MLTTTVLRVALVADLLEERWPSMDLVADSLFSELQHRTVDDIQVEMIRPTLSRDGDGVNRFVRRYWDYARWLRNYAHAYDVFHVVDHSYAHLVHVLPAQRTVVTCHDIDAFLPLVQPELSTSKLPTPLVRLILSGMRKAAAVACDSVATYEDIRRFELVPEDRLAVVRIGTHHGYSPCLNPESDAAIESLLGPKSPNVPELLYVGSSIPRKRIDLLLKIVAAVREIHPDTRLLKAGGPLTPEQRQLAQTLSLGDAIVELPFLEIDHLASLYRRVDMLITTSEREGFGLPLVEAMACGTPVVATDMPVFREVGGAAINYCPLGDIAAWRSTILSVLDGATNSDAASVRDERRRAAIQQARSFSWAEQATTMTQIYRGLGERVARP